MSAHVSQCTGVIKRFQKLGGRIAPALALSATSDGVFSQRAAGSGVSHGSLGGDDGDDAAGAAVTPLRELPAGLQVFCLFY